MAEPLSLLSTSRGVLTAQVMMTILAILFCLCWKLKNQSLKSIVIAFWKTRLCCDRVIKRGLGNLSSQARW